MNTKMRLRAYNVFFGDAFLLSIPDRDANGHVEMRHILIDVGNAYNTKVGKGGEDFVLLPVVRNIQDELGGRPIDLYIATHEHYDHVQGLRYAAAHGNPRIRIPIARSWLTASAAPDYYTRFPNSIMKLARGMVAEVRELEKALTAAGQEPPAHLHLLLDINDPKQTDKCVLHILGQSASSDFIHRDFNLAHRHPFHEVAFDIWAPEEDTAVYYQDIQKLAASTAVPVATRQPELIRLAPPPGVDASAFNNLLNIRRQSVIDTMLFVDKAANNTSLVFTLTWRGWKLLFAADAEQRSWEMMEYKHKLSPVDFIKISHHGSQNGLPTEKMLASLFPTPTANTKKRIGLLSTHTGTYTGVPDPDTLQSYQNLGLDLVSVGDRCAPGEYIDIFFPEGALAPEY